MIQSQLFSKRVPFLVLVTGLLLTALSVLGTLSLTRAKAELELELEATRVLVRLDERLDSYQSVAWAGAGLFEAMSLDVNDAQLRRFRLVTQSGGRNDGLVQMIFVRKVQGPNLSKFLANYPTPLTVDPKPENLDDPVYIVTHIQPETPEHLKTLGFNPSSDPTRKTALERATRTGQASMTGKLFLRSDVLQGIEEPSITIYAPVYHPETERVSSDERQVLLFGFLGASFRLSDLLAYVRRGSSDPLVGFRILSGPLGEGGELVFSTPEPQPENSKTVSQSLVFSGQSWTVEFWALPAFRSTSYIKASTVAVLGLLISLSLFVATFQLFQARKAREEAVRQEKKRNQDLQEQVRLKNQFFSSMNHELRTPLNGLLGMSDLLYDTELSDQQQEYLDAISSCGQALLDIINDVLDLSKIEAGKMTLSPNPTRLKQVFEQAFQVIRGPARGKGLELQFEWDDQLPEWVKLDGPRLRQVLVNLLGNAVKFTETGRVMLRAQQRVDSKNRFLEFSVTDSGVGISKEDQEKLFRPFSQVGKLGPASNAGTGLGLHICKEFLEMMGGSISIESETGQGTTFSGKVPLETLDFNPYETNQMQSVEGLINPDLKVLVVDDNPMNRRVLLLQLAKFGQEADSAADGPEALNKILEGDYDLVFMDCQMPGMDGLEVTRRIREVSPDKPFIVALTAATDEAQQRACLDCGMNFFLPKPIDFSRLNEILATWSLS